MIYAFALAVSQQAEFDLTLNFCLDTLQNRTFQEPREIAVRCTRMGRLSTLKHFADGKIGCVIVPIESAATIKVHIPLILGVDRLLR